MPTRTQPSADILRVLADRIRAVESRGTQNVGVAAPTGLDPIDKELPEGGMTRGASHEVVSVAGAGYDEQCRGALSEWEPSVAFLGHLAGICAGAQGWTVWIGRRVWPYGMSMGAVALDRTLLVDPPDLVTRNWAIDAALRCPGLVVVADASRLDVAASRRVQLAAEAGGSVGLLARPAREQCEVSFASTRWLVAPAGSEGSARTEATRVVTSRWVVTLDRCKGLRRRDSQRWIVERDARGGVLTLASEVAHGSGAAVAAS